MPFSKLWYKKKLGQSSGENPNVFFAEEAINAWLKQVKRAQTPEAKYVACAGLSDLHFSEASHEHGT